MPRPANAPLPQPVFGEPVFSEGVPTPDPTTFKITPTDDGLYNGIQDLLTKDVVGFPQSRVTPHDMFELQTAWGSHGAEVLQHVERRLGAIIQHVEHHAHDLEPAAGQAACEARPLYGRQAQAFILAGLPLARSSF